MRAQLVEIFSSIQGEGLYVGTPTVFVRLGGCDLRCAWCDSPDTWKPSPRCRVEEAPGAETFRELENPVDLEVVLESVARLDPHRRAAISITGGEPLLQAAMVGALGRALKAEQRTVHLETHGAAVDAFAKVSDAVDVVAMDWKLATDVRRAEAPDERVDFHSVHEEFLRRARDAGVSVFVKVVVTPNTRDDELVEICRRIEAVARDVPVVLQPVTPFAAVQEAPSAGALIRWLDLCRERLPDVRVIPQTHRAYGAL